MSRLGIEIVEHESVSVIVVHGGIDAYVVTRIREAISKLVEGEQYRLVIDFKHVEEINSTALGIIIGRLKRVRMHGGDIKIANLHKDIRKIFEVMGASRVFEVYDKVEDAVHAFGPPVTAE